MAYYNITNITAARDVYGLTLGVNQITHGLFGLFILLIVFLVTFAFQRQHNIDSFLVASFITAFVGIGLFFASFIGMAILIIPILLLCVAIFIKIFGDG